MGEEEEEEGVGRLRCVGRAGGKGEGGKRHYIGERYTERREKREKTCLSPSLGRARERGREKETYRDRDREKER